MKYTILHISDPHWICYSKKEFLIAYAVSLAKKKSDKAKCRTNMEDRIEKEVRDYEHIKRAFQAVDLSSHFKGKDICSILAHTGDFANFYDYHKIDIDEQFSEIKSEFIPLIESVHNFDYKVAVPGNHDLLKSAKSDLERFKAFNNCFGGDWRTPGSDVSVGIGPKPYSLRIWLVNSCKRVGHELGKDTAEVQRPDLDKWHDTVTAVGGEDAMRIAMVHHSPVPTNSLAEKRDVFTNNRDFNGTLIASNVKIVLSGHQHFGDELYAAMPNFVERSEVIASEPVIANALIESGFLSLSAPSFLRPAQQGFNQGFNIVEIQIEPDNNIASITVTKYRITAEANGHKFIPHGASLQYRIALSRLHEIFPERKEQERRLRILSNVARDIYSPRTPMEPLERILKIETPSPTGRYVDTFLKYLNKNKPNIFGAYSIAVLSPAAWWAKELTRRFRSIFLEHINCAIHRGSKRSKGKRVKAFFKFSNSLYEAITTSLAAAAELDVLTRLKRVIDADIFNHEEHDWINSSLGGKVETAEGDSMSKWGRRSSLVTYDEGIASEAGGRVSVVFNKGGWDIPDHCHRMPSKMRDFEMARIVLWPLEEFDSDYALRVIEFHEDFLLPLFWLNPTRLVGRKNEPRKNIGSVVFFEKTAKPMNPRWFWNDGSGHSLDSRTSVDNLWGSDNWPLCLAESLESGTAEFKALLKRPDLMFASDVWTLRKMKLTDKIDEYLDSKKEVCDKWLH